MHVMYIGSQKVTIIVLILAAVLIKVLSADCYMLLQSDPDQDFL